MEKIHNTETGKTRRNAIHWATLSGKAMISAVLNRPDIAVNNGTK
jgi:hypothetical protein